MPPDPHEEIARRSLAFAVSKLNPEQVQDLRSSLEDEFDAGAFYLGMQVAAFLMTGIDPNQIARDYPHLLREAMETVRTKAPQKS